MPDRVDWKENGLEDAWKLHKSEPVPPWDFEAALMPTGGRLIKSLPDSSLPGASWAGFEFVSGSEKAALLWSATVAQSVIPLADILFQGVFQGSAGSSAIMKMIALRNAQIVIASYGFSKFPQVALQDPKLNETLSIPASILPAGSQRWAGLHFRGNLALNMNSPGSGLADSKELLEKLFPDTIVCSGFVRNNGAFLSYSLACQPAAENLSLRPGSDWSFSLKKVEMTAILFADRDEQGSLNSISAGGRLTLGGHHVEAEAQLDLAEGTVFLCVEPNWVIDLEWLKKTIGDESYLQGAGSVLEVKSGSGEEPGLAGAKFAVNQVALKLRVKPALTAQYFSVTLGNPRINGRAASWRLLGGDLEASLTGSWQRSPEGVSSFDCMIEGTWTWDAVKFSAGLDTRSGGFYAQLDLGDQKDALAAFARKKLFPGTKPSEKSTETGKPAVRPDTEPPASAEVVLSEEEKAGKTEEQQKAALEQKKRKVEIAAIKAELARPFEIVYFDVSGNYRDKTIEAQVETAGYIGFRLRGKDDADPNRVDVRIGDLLCAGSYDQSSEDAEWSLQVAGTLALLGGGEPKALGAGARVEGQFGSAGTELSLKIKKFDIGEMAGLIMADEPPKALAGVVVEELEIAYSSPKEKASRFALKCKSDIKLFSSVSLKGVELVLVGDEKKKKEPEPVAEGTKSAEKKDKESSFGAAKIGFGKKLVIDLKVEFKSDQIEFKGSAEDVDVGELIEGFFPKQEKPSQSVAGKESHVVAKKISVSLVMQRDRKKDASTGKADSGDAADLVEGSSLVVQIAVGHGESSLGLLLVAAQMGPKGEPGKSEWKILFAGDLDLRAKSLPLVGDILGDKADSFGVELHTLYLKTAAQATRADAKVVERLFKKSDTISAVWKTSDTPPKPLALDEGFGIKADIRTLALPGAVTAAQPAGGTKPATVPTTQTETPPAAGKGLTWSNTDLRIGPVQINRIGYGTAKAEAGSTAMKGTVALDAALDLSVLRLAVVGLGMDVEVPSFKVTPRLEGLAINVRNGPLEITGSLVHRDGVFSGLAQVKTGKMTLGAIGRFSMRESRPSFFLYCVYASPLGGPPAFFIEGLAGGVGYDTRLVMPSVEKVPEFALVKAAKEGLGGAPEEQLATFDACIVAAPNNLWIAAGVRFSSFKMITSTVVIALSIGEDVEIDLFGIMELRVPLSPPGKQLPLVASADLAIRGKFSPRKGEVWLRGELLKGSFLFDEKCRLVGGFAFQAWFDGPNKGDFVATLGGYHPDFKKPDHYFDVPRVGIEWQLTPELAVKGGVYMAITPRAIMAGGRLEMLYQSGSVRVSFVAEAHFLVAWAPLQYKADVRIAVDATFSIRVWRWNKDFHVHLAAQLHLEGPPFSGYARLDLGPITVSISFGKSQPPQPLTWTEFAAAFLPAPQSVITLNATGLTPARKPEELAARNTMSSHWILVPGKSWSFTIETVIPVRKVTLEGGKEQTVPRSGKKLHIVPMDAEMTESELKIVVQGGSWADLCAQLDLEVELMHAPAAPALWSESPSGQHSSGGNDPRLNPPPMKDVPLEVVGIVFRSSASSALRTGEVFPAAQGTNADANGSLPLRARSQAARKLLTEDIFAVEGTRFTRRPTGNLSKAHA